MSEIIEFVPRVSQEIAISDLDCDPFHGLFMDPGLGKTASILEAFRILRERLDIERMLVVAPLRVCYSVWPVEAQKWAQFRDFRVVNLHEGDRREGDIYVCNPEHLPQLFGHRDKEKSRKWIPGYWKNWKHRPEWLVIDESTKFKRASGTRFKTLGRYTQDFARRSILTGTPAPNGYEDLHGQLRILDGGRKLEEGAVLDPRVTYFRKQYFTPVSTGPNPRDTIWKLMPGSAEQIQDAIAPRITCLRAEDWIDLPEKVVTDVGVTLPKRARKHYDSMDVDALIDFGNDDVILVPEEAAAIKCRQICNGFVYDELGKTRWLHSEKIDALAELLAEIGNHNPVMVAYEFQGEFERIQRKLGPFPYIGKGVGPKEGRAIEARWNAGKIPVLLVQPQSTGHGLNLQFGGHRFIWYGVPWDLELYLQTIGRLLRPGQESDFLLIYHLIVRDSIEERVSQVLQVKDRNQEGLKIAMSERTLA